MTVSNPYNSQDTSLKTTININNLWCYLSYKNHEYLYKISCQSIEGQYHQYKWKYVHTGLEDHQRKKGSRMIIVYTTYILVCVCLTLDQYGLRHRYTWFNKLKDTDTYSSLSTGIYYKWSQSSIILCKSLWFPGTYCTTAHNQKNCVCMLYTTEGIHWTVTIYCPCCMTFNS